MKQQSSSPLPPLYADWLDDLLGGEIPSESRSTCSDCAMCDADLPQANQVNYFNPESKCCTYLPLLPNYLVGMILMDDDPAMAAGRASVEERVTAGLAVTPRGLEWPLKIRSQYTQIEPGAFGRAQSLRCPHFVSEKGGLCGIWKYRNSVCSTWFCKYVRGSVGRVFWESTKQLLMSIEMELSRWCAFQLGLDKSALGFLLDPLLLPGQLAKLTLEDLDETVDPSQYRKRWANWHRREIEFYCRAAELVRNLSGKEVLTMCGPEVQLRAALLQQAYRKLMSEEIPDRLRMGTFTVLDVSNGFYSVHTPALGLDRFQMSERVMRLLPHFDGRQTMEIIDQIVDQEGVRFTPELLRRLVDFRILAAVEPA